MLSVKQIVTITEAVAALIPVNPTLAKALTEMVNEAETMRAAAAQARTDAATLRGQRGAPKLPFAIVVNPGETIVCHGAKATAAKLASVLRAHGATRTAPAHTTLGVAISRQGHWQHALETDNGFVTITVTRIHGTPQQESCQTPKNAKTGSC